MTKEDGDQPEPASVRQRLSGRGLAETLRAEKAETKKAKRRARQDAVQPGGGPAALDLSDPDAVKVLIAAAKSDPGTSAAVMIPRLYRACAAQMDRLEDRLKTLLPEAGDVGEIDKTVKTLAGLARALDLVIDLEKTWQAEAAARRDDEHTIDAGALRAALAERLHGLCKGGPDGGGAPEPHA